LCQVLVKHLACVATGALAFPNGVVEAVASDDADRGEEAEGAAFEGDWGAGHGVVIRISSLQIKYRLESTCQGLDVLSFQDHEQQSIGELRFFPLRDSRWRFQNGGNRSKNLNLEGFADVRNDGS